MSTSVAAVAAVALLPVDFDAVPRRLARALPEQVEGFRAQLVHLSDAAAITALSKSYYHRYRNMAMAVDAPVAYCLRKYEHEAQELEGYLDS